MENPKVLTNTFIIIGDGRCVHTMDWYRTIERVCSFINVLFATDLIDSKDIPKIVREEDNIINLYNIDWLLFKKQSRIGDLWRNLIKLLVSPLQAAKIKLLKRKYPNSIFHAHSMYYLFLCWMARIEFIGTPQGSDVLIRPDNSSIYKFFTCKALSAAKYITVDSKSLQNKIRDLCGKESIIIQDGINVSAIFLTKTKNEKNKRTNIISLRGMTPFYNIEKIIEGRANSKLKSPLTFIYPFWEEGYKQKILSRLEQSDKNMGRLPRDKMYELLFATILAISIPQSDSSPRSIYEAIFCGCCVAVTYSPWIDALPSCMRSRLFIIDLEDKAWFDKAIEFAHLITKEPFIPSQIALDLYDQERTMKRVVGLCYKA